VFESVRATPDWAAALYARQAVEARSWKAREGVGISAGPMRAFYQLMLPRLCARGQQRTLFARLGELDIGYVLGAVFEGEYRGLQFSYDAEHARGGIVAPAISPVAEPARRRSLRPRNRDGLQAALGREIMETEMLCWSADAIRSGRGFVSARRPPATVIPTDLRPSRRLEITDARTPVPMMPRSAQRDAVARAGGYARRASRR
jgi:hypothetical protein